MAKYFTLKDKPKRPKRGRVLKNLTVTGGENLQQAMDSLGATDPADITIDFEWGYHDEIEISLTYSRLQTDCEHNEDLDLYKKRLYKYNQWYLKNKDKVKKEIDRRKIEKQQRAEETKKREREQLEKDLAAIQKKLEKP